MKGVADPDDVLDMIAKAVGDEIGVAGMDQGGVEIVTARCGEILDVTLADENIPRVIDYFIWVLSGFEASESDDSFENGTGRVVFLGGAIYFRAEARVVSAGQFTGGIPLHSVIRIDRG